MEPLTELANWLIAEPYRILGEFKDFARMEKENRRDGGRGRGLFSCHMVKPNLKTENTRFDLERGEEWKWLKCQSG